MIKFYKNSSYLLTWVLVLSILLGIGSSTVRAAEEEEETQENVSVQYIDNIEPFEKGALASRDLEEGDELKASSETHELYFNEKTLAIKVKDKQDGYVWSSAVPSDKVEHLSGVWKTFMSSPVVVNYKDLDRPSTTNTDYPKLKEVQNTEQGFILRLNFPKVDLELEAEFYLEEDKIHAKVSDESIHYEKQNDRQFEMSSIYLMPFWGAVDDTETEGYLFIPDGPGALIRYDDEKPYRSPFQSRVYGRDEGQSRIGITLRDIPSVNPENIHMPVYGMSHGHKQHATFVNIENGAEFADIFASPAGVRINFFWANAIFHYIETYFQPTGKAGKTFPYIYKTANPVNPHVSFHMLRDEEADYVGMAKRYREVLQEQDNMPKDKALLAKDKDFPLMINALMSEEERALFFTKLRAMTSIDNLIDWLPELYDLAGNGLVYSLHGAQKGGISGHLLGDLGINRKVGGQAKFNALRDLANEHQIALLLNTDLAVGNEKQMFKGDMVYNVDRDTAWRFTENPIYDKEYFVNMKGQSNLSEKLLNDKQLGEGVGLDLSSVGFTLLSDYTDGMLTDRRTVRENVQAGIETLAAEHPVYMDSPHQYFWQASDAIYNVPSKHSQYIFETDTVPFMQIVLSGSLPMFSQYQNFSTQEPRTILSFIDYNLYPSFLVTEKPSSELMDSNTQNIYFSEFASLKTDITEAYKLLKEILDPVRGVEIESREIPKVNVSITHYANGMAVITNYSNVPFEYEGETIEALSAKLVQ